MILGIFKDIDGKRKENIYFTWDAWHRDTFSPAVDIEAVILFKVSGKTYTERKNNLIELAKDYQYNEQGGLSYGELAEIYDFFEKNAKRYGLLKEFRENGIL